MAGLAQVTLRADARTQLSIAMTRDSGLQSLVASAGALSPTGFVVPAHGLPEAWSLTVRASGVTAHWGAALVDAAWQNASVTGTKSKRSRRSTGESRLRVGTVSASLLRVVTRRSGQSSVHVIEGGREVVIELENTTTLEIDASAPAVPFGLLEVDEQGLSFRCDGVRVQIAGTLVFNSS